MLIIFLFKQETAYEMRISDWSSDVCSSDLVLRRRRRDELAFRAQLVRVHGVAHVGGEQQRRDAEDDRVIRLVRLQADEASLVTRQIDTQELQLRLIDRQRFLLGVSEERGESGRASGRERVCQYV